MSLNIAYLLIEHISDYHGLRAEEHSSKSTRGDNLTGTIFYNKDFSATQHIKTVVFRHIEIAINTNAQLKTRMLEQNGLEEFDNIDIA